MPRLTTTCLVAAIGLLFMTPAEAQIPPRAEASLIADYQRLLTQEQQDRIARFQAEALEQYDTPIVVVTVQSMRRHGATRIEQLAYNWFNAWEIGTMDHPGGANQGILVIVAVSDRRARIELGADWGRRFDAATQRIMDGSMVPRFRNDDYGGGLVAGVEQLLRLARSGPHGAPPGPSLGERARSTMEGGAKLSLLPPTAAWAFAGLGVLIMGASFFLPEQRKTFLIVGGAFVAIGLLTWIVFAALAVASRGSGSSSGGFGGGGGGFSGGFSGGGGASGSW